MAVSSSSRNASVSFRGTGGIRGFRVAHPNDAPMNQSTRTRSTASRRRRRPIRGGSGGTRLARPLPAACGQSLAAQFSRWGLERRSIPAETLRFASFIVALRSKYTRASSPGGGSSLARLVSRAPRPHRETGRSRRSRHFVHRLLTVVTGFLDFSGDCLSFEFLVAVVL